MDELEIHLKRSNRQERVASANDTFGSGMMIFLSVTQWNESGSLSVFGWFNLVAGGSMLVANLGPWMRSDRFALLARWLKIAGSVCIFITAFNVAPGSTKLFNGPTALTGFALLVTTVFEQQMRTFFKKRFGHRRIVFRDEGVLVKTSPFRTWDFAWSDLRALTFSDSSATIHPQNGKPLELDLIVEASRDVRRDVREFLHRHSQSHLLTN